ncbi:MAG: hypothetical protein NTW14_03685 [bacterium]|nr:hypothetical protein [bacterium]
MEVIELKSFAEVKQYPFPGSPTVLINGVDLEPAARSVDYVGTA